MDKLIKTIRHAIWEFFHPIASFKEFISECKKKEKEQKDAHR